jgi:hypothetical protein
MRGLALLTALPLAGCAVDLGAGTGAEVTSPHVMGLGRVAAQTRLGAPMNERGALVGAEVDSRTEYRVGSRFSGGIMLGYGDGPATIGQGPLSIWGIPVGWEIHGDVGTVLGDTLYPDWTFYGGVALAAPTLLASSRQISDLNESTWVLMRRIEIVPMLRGRMHFDRPFEDDAFFRLDVAGIVNMRLRTITDLF